MRWFRPVPHRAAAHHVGAAIRAYPHRDGAGHGAGWTELDPDVDPPVADVALRPELIVRGRMFDVKGQPAPAVTLRIESVIPVVRGTRIDIDLQA